MFRSFSGVHERKFDYKNRITIPEQFSQPGSAGLQRVVVMKGESEVSSEDGEGFAYLYVWDMETWDSLLEEGYRQMDEDEGRKFMNNVVRDAASADVDASSRVTIPERLLHYAGIEKQAKSIVAGIFDHLEVWSFDRWLAYHSTRTVQEEVEIPSIPVLARSRIRQVS
jgi:DNA-binding transcriptional regulator/RsmH inhibitor MraZ